MTRMCTDADAIFWSNASVDVSLKLVHDHVHYMWLCSLCSIEQTECAFYSYHFMHTVPGHVQWWMGGGGGGDVGSVANS